MTCVVAGGRGGSSAQVVAESIFMLLLRLSAYFSSFLHIVGQNFYCCAESEYGIRVLAVAGSSSLACLSHVNVRYLVIIFFHVSAYFEDKTILAADFLIFLLICFLVLHNFSPTHFNETFSVAIDISKALL